MMIQLVASSDFYSVVLLLSSGLRKNLLIPYRLPLHSCCCLPYQKACSIEVIGPFPSQSILVASRMAWHVKHRMLHSREKWAASLFVYRWMGRELVTFGRTRAFLGQSQSWLPPRRHWMRGIRSGVVAKIGPHHRWLGRQLATFGRMGTFLDPPLHLRCGLCNWM